MAATAPQGPPVVVREIHVKSATRVNQVSEGGDFLDTRAAALVEFRVRDAERGAPDGKDALDAWIGEAIVEHAVTDHPGRPEEEYVHRLGPVDQVPPLPSTLAIAVMVFQLRVVTGTPKSRSNVPR